ncbi:MAG: protein-glutamate O-methyltransferase CheR [Tissierellia bacterium]|nr:protein-glutamate O-methyltransferase CheR [Tissierellia bacterium]
MVKLTDKEFLEFVKYMHNNYGIDLSKKRILIEGRLSNIIKKKGMTSFGQYLDRVKSNKDDEIITLVNKLTTNYTYFYREENHFQYLKEVVLPEEEKENTSRSLNIWSAGCSSGEEPYTIAMVLDDYFKLKKWKINIKATDISENVLSKAKEAIYSEESIKRLPDRFKQRYFKKVGNGYEVTEEIKKYVNFNVFNLMDPILEKNKYHLIFLRNVMIYFNNETKLEIVNKIYEAIKPGGYLFIGHAETIQRNKSKFHYIKPAIYKKK